jgi:signal transduction histidine kinase
MLNVGNTYLELGEYRTALQYHLDALRLFEEVDNKMGISFCYQMIGGSFLSLKQQKSAMTYTRRSLDLKRELHDERGTATSLHQMGSVYRNEKNLDSATCYYAQAIKIFQRMGLKNEELNMDLDMGTLYVDAGLKDSAKVFFERGKQLAQAAGDTGRLATFNAGLASLQTSVKDDKDMEKKLTGSLRHSIETGDKTAELINYQYLASYYAKVGQAQKATEFVKRYYATTDSLDNIRVQTQLKKMESQYNVDKKEQEIALLKKDQQLSHLDLEKQKILLEKQKIFEYGAVVFILLLMLIGLLVINRYRIVHRARRAIEIEKMRNHIARDLHDDVGSTLTSINILSKVALQAPEQQEAGQRAVFIKIKERTSAIIEKMDDIVWTIHPQNDTMERLLFRMKEFAAEILEPLGINYEFDEKGDLASLKLDVQKRKDLYLLFKEAVNNAAKYSECQNLRIRLWREKNSLQMEIADDGRGFAEDGIRAGNGLGSMRERAASMVADIRIDSVVGEGTRIALDMPIG